MNFFRNTDGRRLGRNTPGDHASRQAHGVLGTRMDFFRNTDGRRLGRSNPGDHASRQSHGVLGTRMDYFRLALLVPALLTVSGCSCGGEAPTVPVDAGPTLIGPESVAEVKQEQIKTGPRIAGSLQAREQAQVRAESGGSVLSVHAELGEPVKKGQLLAKLEARAQRDAFNSAQSSVRAAAQELDVAQRQVERTEKLVEAGALAQRELELAQSAAAAARARLDQARAGLGSAEQQVDATVVTSPMNGVISQKAVNTGDVVAPGAPLFTVIDPSTMRLEASVPTEQLSAIAEDTPVSFVVRGYPGQTFTGTIERVSPAADPVTRQIPILVELPNVSGKLVAGLFAEGRVAAEQREGLVVPEAAVALNGEQAHVLRIRDGKVERIAVKVGVRNEAAEEVEISGELAAGDKVLTGPARELSSGTAVELTGNDRQD